MSLFQRLLGYKKTQPNTKSNLAKVNNDSARQIMECGDFIKSILKSDRYIARSEYATKISEYSSDIEFFDVLKKSNMLTNFCKKNALSTNYIEGILKYYKNIQQLVDKHNDKFVEDALVSEKEYLDNILKSVDPNILLDDDQRKVVLTDEDYSLVVAGAGAGKTTTVAAKVKYLVDRKNIDPSQILVVSFTNKAVNELKERINKELDVSCPIATFHSTGNAILHKNSPDEKLNIVEKSKLYIVIRDYFRSSILKNESVVNNLIMFFASYFDAPYEGNDLNAFFNNIAKANFTTMRSDLEDFKQDVIDIRTKKSVTIQNEMLRSYQEVEIANFLYLHNIDYEYEPLYKYDIEFSKKPYTPDFYIHQGDKSCYLEHFGISEAGTNDRFTPEQVEKYKKAVRDKCMLHKQHGTSLIYTFSKYNDNRTLIEHLKEKLEAKGFDLTPRSNKEVMEKLVTTEENRYIRKLIYLVCRFISNFKVNNFQVDDFNRMYHSSQNVRNRLFLNICNDCYLEYERWLKENNAVDFEDMINESTRLLREVKDMKKKLDFKYIIVDEYQDISRQRFDLTKALSEITDAKIIAVGDDWQSIYAFSGSDITLFTKFEEKMGYAKLLKIVNTYRNSQEVIDIAGTFIQRNKAQIQKRLISPKHIEDPVIIYTYDGKRKGVNTDRRSGISYEMSRTIEKVLEDILSYKKKEGKEPGPILLLGRYGFDADHLERAGLFEFRRNQSKIRSVKYPKLDITFMTAHSSKGLGYDDVIVLNGKNETYGFPSKIEDDPVLSFVLKEDKSIDYAEERRLFYVAMTRTKNRVFFLAPEENPSEFLLELKQSFKNVKLLGDWNEEPPVSIAKKTCPICGYPMQLKYKRAYGMRLYICTNEPEICDFMTNNYAAGKLAIQKCDKCRDGYLIVKPGNGFFLGCTNFKKNGTGCNRTIAKQAYYTHMGYEMEKPVADVSDNKNVMIVPKKQAELESLSEIYSNTLNSDKDFIPKKVKVEKETKKSEDNKNPISNNKPSDYVEVKRADIDTVYFEDLDLNDAVYNIIKAVQNISSYRYFGVTVLCRVLRESQSEVILKYNLDTVPEYGIYRDIDFDVVKSIVEWMISEHYILQTKSYYPVLHSTYEGLHYSETITTNKLQKLKIYLDENVL